jgi:polysaccharide biosynthesis protein PslJ
MRTAASLAAVASVSPSALPPVMAAADGPRGGGLSPAWPLIVLFPLLPLWWALGVSGVTLSLLVLPLLAALILRRRLLVPRGFGLYLLFLLWCVFSAAQLITPRQWVSAGYRGSMYLAAGLLFLYILNAPRDRLPPDRAVRILGGFFILIALGGVAGMLIPTATFTTPAKALTPTPLLSDPFIQALVSASTSTGKAFAAYPIFRPKAPFIYTNEWGATYAMTLPFALCLLTRARTRVGRDLMALTLVLSILPLVFSLNRGAWLSASVGVLYAVLRLARSRNGQVLRVIAGLALVVAVIVVVTPIDEIVVTRLANGYGDAHREQLYSDSIALVRESPIVGHGAPVLVEGDVSAGTHGQLWTIVVSQGIPGLVFFTGWLIWAWWKASRRLPPGHPGDASVRFWCEVAIVVALAQMPYYDLLPWGLSIAMVAAALAWREQLAFVAVAPPATTEPVAAPAYA